MPQLPSAFLADRLTGRGTAMRFGGCWSRSDRNSTRAQGHWLTRKTSPVRKPGHGNRDGGPKPPASLPRDILSSLLLDGLVLGREWVAFVQHGPDSERRVVKVGVEYLAVEPLLDFGRLDRPGRNQLLVDHPAPGRFVDLRVFDQLLPIDEVFRVRRHRVGRNRSGGRAVRGQRSRRAGWVPRAG